MSVAVARLPRYPVQWHAVERFVQRVRPDLNFRDPDEFVRAELELWAFMADARLIDGPHQHAWVRTNLFLLKDDVAVILAERGHGRRVAVTVVTK